MSSCRAALPFMVLALAVVGAPRDAQACSGGSCFGGFFLPADGGTVPANLPGIVWQPRAGQTGAPDPSHVALFRVATSGEIAVPITEEQQNNGHVYVSPVAALAPDADYVIRGADTCKGTGMVDATATQSTFHTGSTIALPATLGSLAASAPSVGPLQVWTVSGSCTASITAAQASIDLTLSPEAGPWQKALLVETLVDGQPWRFLDNLNSVPALGGGLHTVVYAMCATADDGADKGLSVGSHSVTMRAILAGSMVSVETAPVSVTLQCSTAAGGNGVDGGTGEAASSVDGGGCNLPGGSAGGHGCWLVAAGIAGLLRRRRRQPGERASLGLASLRRLILPTRRGLDAGHRAHATAETPVRSGNLGQH